MISISHSLPGANNRRKRRLVSYEIGFEYESVCSPQNKNQYKSLFLGWQSKPINAG